MTTICMEVVWDFQLSLTSPAGGAKAQEHWFGLNVDGLAKVESHRLQMKFRWVKFLAFKCLIQYSLFFFFVGALFRGKGSPPVLE